MHLSFDPVAKLTIGSEEYHGINIVEKLHQLKDTDPDAAILFGVAVRMHQHESIPSLGFCAEDNRSVIPTKRVIDVGYDITVIDIASQLTPATTLYETGISLIIPLGYYVEMVPRSSLSKSGYVFANSIGIIDPGYTGTIKVALVKIDEHVEDLQLPARVAQIILKPYIFSSSFIADEKNKIHTSRGAGGFGST